MYGEPRYGRAGASRTWLVAREDRIGECKLQRVMERADERVPIRHGWARADELWMGACQ
jgi:hypothetical protein